MNEVAVDADVHHLIYAAIQKKQLILFGYKDKERVVEPHDYGIQNGIARLLSWPSRRTEQWPYPRMALV